MLKMLPQLSANKWFWLFLLFLSTSFEVTALLYQYKQDYLPCVLCIHTRIWALGIFVVALMALGVYKNRFGLFIVQLLMTIMMAGLFERSYQLFGTERGFISGSCSMESGLPVWFALDKWLPSVFEVQEPCGYTPELFFGITMAEALIVLSALLFIINALLLINLFVRHFLLTNRT